MRKKSNGISKLWISIFILSGFFLFFVPTSVAAAEWHVSTAVGSDTAGDGSPTQPFASIQKAINEAASGDIVKVARGEYDPINISEKDVSLFGGFNEADWTQDSEVNKTIIDGGDAAVCVEMYKSSGIFEGFIVQNGRAEDQGGGGFNISEGEPVIQDCLITNNYAQGLDAWGGGGILCGDADLTLDHCYIIDNYSDNGAGGVRIGGGTFLIENSIIANNQGATALHVNSTSGEIQHTTIAYNNDGGTGFNWSEVNVSRSIVWGNDYHQNWKNDSNIIYEYSLVENGADGSGNINTPPLFCDPQLNNFSLAANSPCLGTGKDGSNMGAVGDGCGEITTIDYKIQWWHVQKREYEDGRAFNVSYFSVTDLGGNFILEDVIDDITLYAPDGTEVPLDIAEFEGKYHMLYGTYLANTGQWQYYGDNLHDESYYKVEFNQPIQSGEYHLELTDKYGRIYNEYKECDPVDIELPIISAGTFFAEFQGEGDLVWTWAPPKVNNLDVNMSVEAYVYGMGNDGAETHIWMRIPAHMGYLFIPKSMLDLLETEIDEISVGLYLMTGNDSYRVYSNNLSLSNATAPPTLGDINGDRKIDLKEAVHALQVTSGVR